MDQPGSRAFHSPPCGPERDRIQELSRYYCTLDRPPAPLGDIQCIETATPHGDERPSFSHLSSDITLTALAQLGVHRFGCNRSFVSLIDGDNQHLIAEATASVSLRNKDKHLPNDGIYLGVRTLDLVWGVCPHAIRLFTGQDLSYAVDTQNVTANRSRYIIRDFTKEDLYKDRPYVCEWPHMRFYAEVPLYSASGYVLGSFCVVDNKPRAAFGDDEVDMLQEIADAVAKHLENVRIVHCHRRSESLVKGLTNFVKASNERLESPTYIIDGLQGGTNVVDTLSSASSSITEQASSSGPGSRSINPSSLNSDRSDHHPMLGEEKVLYDALKSRCAEKNKATPSSNASASLTDNISISDSTTAIFSRASVLLRDSMDLDGVVFLDAARINPLFPPSDDQPGWEPLPSSAVLEFPLAPCPSPLGLSSSSARQGEVTCDILSCALKGIQPEASDAGQRIEVSEQLLNLLVAKFPQGQTFTLDTSTGSQDCISSGGDYGAPTSQVKSTQQISQKIMQLFPGARSVLLSPIWDYNKSRWTAATLVWTRDTHRALGMEELHYFKVFGDSIVSEVSRVHWMATEKSKFNFVSSISHELRSPLHGILASAELLHATALQPAQEEMVKMIEASGLNLLDTTDHLLEFCKINSLTQAKRTRGQRSGRDTSGLVSDFDLGI